MVDVALTRLAEVADFLSASGASTSVIDGRRLEVGSSIYRPPAAVMRDPELCRRWIDAFVADHLSEQLVAAVRRGLPTEELGVRIAVSGDGDVGILDRRSVRVAEITATRATLAGAAPLNANFFAPGPHWEHLTEALDDSAGGVEPFAPAQLHRKLPEETDPELLEAASEASRRLRLERTLVFPHDVRIDVEDVSVILSPLTPPPPPLMVPFSLERGEDRFSGSLRVSAVDNPWACDWHQGSDLETLAAAWTLALAAYAELTCVPLRVVESRKGGRSATASRGSRPRGAGATRPFPRPRSGSNTLPTSFLARGETARYLASYVAGHRRRLLGHAPSAEAEGNATAVGIRLRPGETWVQPHVRGVAPEVVLHFAWHGPTWTKDAFG